MLSEAKERQYFKYINQRGAGQPHPVVCSHLLKSTYSYTVLMVYFLAHPVR